MPDELRLAEGKYRSLFELSGEGMLLVEPETHCIADTNHAFLALCGLEVAGLALDAKDI